MKWWCYNKESYTYSFRSETYISKHWLSGVPFQTTARDPVGVLLHLWSTSWCGGEAFGGVFVVQRRVVCFSGSRSSTCRRVHWQRCLPVVVALQLVHGGSLLPSTGVFFRVRLVIGLKPFKVLVAVPVSHTVIKSVFVLQAKVWVWVKSRWAFDSISNYPRANFTLSNKRFSCTN